MAAERLYWCQRPSELATLPAAGPSWSGSPGRSPDILSTEKLPSDITSSSISETSATPIQRLWAQVVTDVRTSGLAITGTLNWCLGVSESNIAADAYWAVHATVVTADGGTVLATLINDYTENSGTGTEFTTIANGTSPAAPVSITPYTPLVPYRVVIEIGVIFQNLSITSRAALTRLGATTGDVPTPLDLTPGDTNITTRAGWFEFSSALGALAGPTNDAFANAINLAPLTTPYVTQVDISAASEESLDPTPADGNFYQERKSLWWTWLADENVRTVAYTFGSDYDTVLSIWTGSPGAFVEVTSNHRIGNTGVFGAKDRGNSYVTWDAVSGTTYYILVQSFSEATGTACDPLTDGDLYLTVGKAGDFSYQNGDLLVGDNALFHYDGVTGLVKQVIFRGPDAEYLSGSTIAADGTILITAFEDDVVERWDAQLLTKLTEWTTAPGENPLTIVADLNGKAYVGFMGDAGGVFPGLGVVGTAPTRPIQQWDVATGTLENSWTPDPDQTGPVYIDFRDSSVSGFAYAALGRALKSFSKTAGQLPDLFTFPSDGGTLQYVRLLSDGTFLVVDTLTIQHVQADGTVLQTYTHPDITNWHATKINGDGTFWASNPYETDADLPLWLVKFDLATGAILEEWPVPTIEDGPCGIGPEEFPSVIPPSPLGAAACPIPITAPVTGQNACAVTNPSVN